MVVHLVGDLPCVEVEPKPLGVQWDLEDEEGRALEVADPAEEVGDQGEGHNLEEGGLGAVVPLVAGQTDQGKEQGEEACHHDSEDQQGVGEGLGQEVEDLEGQEDQEGDVGDPAFHLKKKKNTKDKTHEQRHLLNSPCSMLV